VLQPVISQISAPSQSAVSPPGFAGRQRELAGLAAVLGEPPVVMLVEGEAGIGKTRLLQEYMASPAGQAHRVLVACCPPFRQPHTLGPRADAQHRCARDPSAPGRRLPPGSGGADGHRAETVDIYGGTWQAARVVGGGEGRFTATYTVPAAGTNGHVSIKAEASDADGNDITQTLINAYGIATAAP
jgi:hypothetical protein